MQKKEEADLWFMHVHLASGNVILQGRSLIKACRNKFILIYI